jgi:hypothetical protein
MLEAQGAAMTEPAAPQVAPTSPRSGAIVFFGALALLWMVWLGGIVSIASDHELYQRLSAKFDER